MGTFNTLKATIEEVKKTRGSCRLIGLVFPDLATDTLAPLADIAISGELLSLADHVAKLTSGH